MSKRITKSYPLEFKQSSAKLAAESEQPISEIAEALGVNRSCYYEWRNSRCSLRRKEDEILSGKIKMIFNHGRKTYGTRRIKKRLAKEELIASRRRIGKLMLILLA